MHLKCPVTYIFCSFGNWDALDDSFVDLFNQIKLFHKTDRTEIPIGTESLRLFQKGVEEKIYRMPDLLKHVMIRRCLLYTSDAADE